MPDGRAANQPCSATTFRPPIGAPLPGASVTLANRVSQAAQSAVTDASGKFSLPNIAFGTYVLSVTLSGFSAPDQVVEVRTSVPIARDVQMTPGALTETVTVSADAWIDAVQHDRRLVPLATTSRPDCPGIRQSVQFEITSEPLTLQFGGASVKRLNIAVLRAR